ncbi:MAG TPA: tautomerase family protein [Gemmatimonadaceae bacterium]|jgi:4-oxalocrotonate tautomerase
MPHVVVKMIVGRSEELKRRLAEQIVKDVMAIVGSEDSSVSVAIEDVSPGQWNEQVYDAEIVPGWDALYKKPGYGSRASK